MSTKANTLTRRFGSVKAAAGMATFLIIAATLISCVSSFQIYKQGFTDLAPIVGIVFSLLCVALVEGAFTWMLFGYAQAFSSSLERLLALIGMTFLVAVMATNLVTHFQQVKGSALHPFQEAWLSWAAVTVFIAVLILVILIRLSNPLTRLTRLEIRAAGRELEAELAAKLEALDSETVYNAMARRAEIEAGLLAQRIIGGAAGSAAVTAEADKRIEGFGRSERAIWRGGERIDSKK